MQTDVSARALFVFLYRRKGCDYKRNLLKLHSIVYEVTVYMYTVEIKEKSEAVNGQGRM